MSLPTFEKKRLMGVIAVLSFGLTSLFAVSSLEFLVPATFITGFFLLLPLVWLLGDDFPLVEPARSTTLSSTIGRPRAGAAFDRAIAESGSESPDSKGGNDRLGGIERLQRGH